MSSQTLGIARVFVPIALGYLSFVAPASAVEIKAMASAAFKAAYLQIFPQFERATGNTIVNSWGPAMGTTPQAVPNRIARGEPVDVVIVSDSALQDLIQKGKVVASSRRELAISTIGAAVRAGAPKPDISTVDSFKQALENAKSIAYSDSVSGVYISTVLYDKLGVSEKVKAKSTMILADPVGGVVADGKAELGFQQISELKPVKGIDIVGPIPSELQKVTIYVAGVATGAEQPEAGAALLKFLSSPAMADIVRNTGMTPPSQK